MQILPSHTAAARLALAVLLLLSAHSAAAGTTRTYYIAAQSIIWDYTPGWPNNAVTGKRPGEGAGRFTDGSRRDRIGHRYRKAVYRAYTDATFTTEVARPEAWGHLGLLGPVLRAAVGDTIRVVFRNMLERPASLQPQGVFYPKDAEGRAYNDGTAGAAREDDAVPPGGTHTYTWEVPQRAGPGPADPSSIAWLYHSGVEPEADLNAGLVGPILITRQFQARPDGSPADVDHEYVALFAVFDENASFLAGQNRKSLAPEADPADPEYRESNRMYTINGYAYGNLPGLTMKLAQRVRWHLLSLPGAGGMHSPHWQGNGVTAYGSHADTLGLLPGTSKSVTMEADNPGTWLLDSAVGSDAANGMAALYKVEE